MSEWVVRNVIHMQKELLVFVYYVFNNVLYHKFVQDLRFDTYATLSPNVLGTNPTTLFTLSISKILVVKFHDLILFSCIYLAKLEE